MGLGLQKASAPLTRIAAQGLGAFGSLQISNPILGPTLPYSGPWQTPLHSLQGGQACDLCTAVTPSPGAFGGIHEHQSLPAQPLVPAFSLTCPAAGARNQELLIPGPPCLSRGTRETP